VTDKPCLTEPREVVAGQGDEIFNPLHKANYDVHRAAFGNPQLMVAAAGIASPLDALQALMVKVVPC
jgi:hypothetical protein